MNFKYLLLPFGILLFFTSFAEAQTCTPPETFTTQTAIDNFPRDYPDCVELEGNLVIDQDFLGGITNLDSLQQITKIKGDLLIGNTSLVNLEGLNQFAGEEL